jgi:hypothetical protein
MAVLQEEKTGVIESYYDGDTGVIRETGSNATRDFYQPGAQRLYMIGIGVTYLLLTLPNGRTITNEVKNK